jgi:cyclopropane fatty-acyl-phospholipid synthase-like methyltransferase
MGTLAIRLVRKLQLVLSPARQRHALVGPAHLWKAKRAFQIQFLKQVGLQPHHYLLDIGCGTLRGGVPMIAYLEKGHYFGIESRADVLEEGKQELAQSHLEHKEPILVAASDVSHVNLRQHFDYIWAFSVLIHMTDKILGDCLNLIQSHLAYDGYFYANAKIGPRVDGTWGKFPEFPLVTRSLEFYQEISERNGLHLTDMGPLKALGHSCTGDEQHMLRIRKASLDNIFIC